MAAGQFGGLGSEPGGRAEPRLAKETELRSGTRRDTPLKSTLLPRGKGGKGRTRGGVRRGETARRVCQCTEVVYGGGRFWEVLALR